MKIAVHDNDKTGFPNLALMKLSAWHKAKGDTVEWFNPLFGRYDHVYSSKVFTFTPTDKYLPDNTKLGGTGHSIQGNELNDGQERICPDYNLYNCDCSYGFTTRGCIRSCDFCFVPLKEGKIRPHADIDQFLKHKNLILMDNNILAHPHGLQQLEKVGKLGVKLDCNQGMDARLIDKHKAKILSKIKWIKNVRLACDSQESIAPVKKAVKILRDNNVTPRAYFVYTLVRDVEEAYSRIMELKALGLDPFAQPYRDPEGTEPTYEQKRFARWVNHKAIFKTVDWKDYK